MPAWCPDWRQDYRTSSLIRIGVLPYSVNSSNIPDLDQASFHADNLKKSDEPLKGGVQESPFASRPLPFFFSGRSLVCSGVILDTVVHASRAPYDWFPTIGVERSWFDLVFDHTRNPDSSTPSEGEISIAFGSMLVGDRSGTWNIERNLPEGYLRYKLPSVEYWTNEDRSHPNEQVDCGTRVTALFKGRRLVITEKGCMGLAPWYVRPGFKLAILLGCSVTVVLEELPEGKARGGENPGLHFRGDCFVQGWMEGEMLRQFGDTTEAAWEKIRGLERLTIF